jgi:hypothetical protein
MGSPWTHLGAATAVADVDRFVVIGNGAMKVGAYTLSVTTMPEAGTARRVTITHATVAVGTDTLGTVTVVGKNLAGQTITEVLVPVADSMVTGTQWFASIASITGADWVIAGGNDTITVGCAATAIIAQGSGTLEALQINTTSASTIVVADATGTIATLPANVAVGTLYEWEISFTDYLSVQLNGASDVTVIHSGSMPSSY